MTPWIHFFPQGSPYLSGLSPRHPRTQGTEGGPACVCPGSLLFEAPSPLASLSPPPQCPPRAISHPQLVCPRVLSLLPSSSVGTEHAHISTSSPGPSSAPLLPSVPNHLLDSPTCMFLKHLKSRKSKTNSPSLPAPQPAAPPNLTEFPAQKPGPNPDPPDLPATLSLTPRSQLVIKLNRFCLLDNSQIHHPLSIPRATGAPVSFPDYCNDLLTDP